ncbi:MAG: NAD-dependent epimerase/dehydratase family protein [Bryobacter sp.]|nr:NAD-dependent epimerase/dehydratase family protein [Bryobacter sp.]
MRRFRNEEDLEDYLAQPTAPDLEAAQALEGDIVLLGAGGKMGPTLALRIKRALDAVGKPNAVLALSRFSDAATAERLTKAGVKIVSHDLLSEAPSSLAPLPAAPNVIFLAGRKFGSSGQPGLTWMMNVVAPARVAQAYRESRMVVLSSGNIYPLRPVNEGGANEQTPVAPVGEYAQTVLGRERIFEYFAEANQTPVVMIRLNYAVEPRYGVIVDIAEKIWRGETVDLTMGYLNAIWQGDANSVVFRALAMASPTAPRLNLTGLEILSVRELALQLADRLGKGVEFSGTEAPTALLNDARACAERFGPPLTPIEAVLDSTAQWMLDGHVRLGKPTHFETRDGKF